MAVVWDKSLRSLALLFAVWADVEHYSGAQEGGFRILGLFAKAQVKSDS